MFPSLKKSCKHRFPFRISAPSFIYPTDYEANVRMLGPFLDEIELLFFESRFDGSLPSIERIELLKDLAEQHVITYNIHLPTDVFLGAPDPTKRQMAVDTICRFLDQTAPLAPTTYTLHLEARHSFDDPEATARWQENVIRSLEETLDAAPVSAEDLSIETLLYPVKAIEPVIDSFQMGLCFDTGHLLLSSQNILSLQNRRKASISIYHIHGVSDGKDHRPLQHLPGRLLQDLASRLKQFTGTVSIEVFSFDHLQASLHCFSAVWEALQQKDAEKEGNSNEADRG